MPSGCYIRKPFSEEHKRNLSSAGCGRIFSEYHRKYMSEARTGVT